MTEAAGREFEYRVRVPYAHTDQMGVVYYANYLVYFEMARAAMLREVGLPYGELEKQGLALPVIEASCLYKHPARYDDEVRVASRCLLAGPRLRVDYVLTCGQTLVATGFTVHACVAPGGKVVRPPPLLCRLTAP